MQFNSETSEAILIDTVQLHKVVDFMLKNNVRANRPSGAAQE